QRVAHAVNVHDATRGKVQDGFAQFRGTLLVHAAVIGLAFGPHDMPAANGTLLRHLEALAATRMLVIVNDARDLGDYIASTFDFHPVADLHAQALDLVHVVQSGPAYGCSADGNWFQLRNRRELARASDLNVNVFNLRDARASCILVRDCPPRGFAREAKLTM